MEKVKALLLANTVAANGEVTGEDFMKAQEEMNEPMVIFCNLHTQESYEHFRIVAKDMEHLESMYKEKVFYTYSIPKDEVKRYGGAIFWGVNADYYKKERTAVTGVFR
jgi:hypothetical protein